MRHLLPALICSLLAAAPSLDQRFQKVRDLARGRERQLFAMFTPELPADERHALQVLYASMPLQDLADQDGALFHRAVKATLAARAAMPWGPRIPDGLFNAYVLPVRVNTENLDEARPVLWAALRDRVKGLTMEAAALEVNHWCHEHVTYRGADARTSGPLATLRTTWGRCGEESTLLVSALRAVGIPARQVYTPRWAHVDDNHAWVEAWIDGTWHYLGACEPAPALDMGWFREPARRAMMVHAKAYGGDPERLYSLRRTSVFDEVQLLARYAPAVDRTVTVVDGKGRPVPGATVEFGLYNYAEFYPLATRDTDARGRASLLAGRGDLRLWARKGDRVGTVLLNASARKAVLRLAPFDPRERVEQLDLHPPAEPMPSPIAVPDAARERTRQRCADGDRARNAIMATFMAEPQARTLATGLGLDPALFWPLLQKSQGNHAEITAFLRETCPDRRKQALALLGTLSDKDLRDTPATILADHLAGALSQPSPLLASEPAVFRDFVLCPRIHNELLTPWRSALERALGHGLLTRFSQAPASAVAWVRDRIRLDAEANAYGVPMRPRGTLELGVADALGRDVLLVAILRTAGVPARLEPGSSAPQYRTNTTWTTVDWTPSERAPAPRALLKLTGTFPSEPVYSVHYALSRFTEGRYETLDFEGRSWSALQAGLDLPQGHYCLTTGTREHDGSVHARLHYFPLTAGRSLALVLPPNAKPPRALARLDLTAFSFTPLAFGPSSAAPAPQACAAPVTPKAGLILAWVGLSDEPSIHALQDLAKLAEPIEKWGGELVLVLGQAPRPDDPALARLKDLPSRTRIVLDDGTGLKAARKALQRPAGAPLPCILGVSARGDVLFQSEGYRIGVGEQVLKAIHHLDR